MPPVISHVKSFEGRKHGINSPSSALISPRNIRLCGDIGNLTAQNFEPLMYQKIVLSDSIGKHPPMEVTTALAHLKLARIVDSLRPAPKL
jgi:hypothetical protein